MTYDIIFAGGAFSVILTISVVLIRLINNQGGTTACVVAGRLAASRPDLRILVYTYYIRPSRT